MSASVKTVYGTGYSTTAPAEAQTVMLRDTFARDGTVTPIIFSHPFGGGSNSAFPVYTNPTYLAIPAILRQLARCGWPVVIADLGGDTWGNATSRSRTDEAIAYARSAAIGAKTTGPIILAGYSEGGGAAMAYARGNPSNVKAMVLFNPASDLHDAVVNNRNNSAASINAAFGGAYNDSTDGPLVSPVKFAAQLAGIPTLIYNSANDPYVIPSTVATVVSLIGSSCTQHLTNGDHGDGSLLTIDPLAVSSWLFAHDA